MTEQPKSEPDVMKLGWRHKFLLKRFLKRAQKNLPEINEDNKQELLLLHDKVIESLNELLELFEAFEEDGVTPIKREDIPSRPPEDNIKLLDDMLTELRKLI